MISKNIKQLSLESCRFQVTENYFKLQYSLIKIRNFLVHLVRTLGQLHRIKRRATDNRTSKFRLAFNTTLIHLYSSFSSPVIYPSCSHFCFYLLGFVLQKAFFIWWGRWLLINSFRFIFSPASPKEKASLSQCPAVIHGKHSDWHH